MESFIRKCFDRALSEAFIWCLFTCLSTVTVGFAQVISTDRPGISFSSQIVPQGRFQLEGGAFYSKNDDNGTNEFAFRQHPVVALRYGIISTLEMQLQTSWQSTSIEKQRRIFTSNGIGSSAISAKWNFLTKSTELPLNATIFGALSLPLGQLDDDNPRPALLFLLDYSLDNEITLTSNIGFNGLDGSEFQYTLAVDIAVFQQGSVFLEVFGNHSTLGDILGIDYGLLYRLNDNLQLDMNIGHGLSDNAPDVFITIGISYLL
jgi:hypothetical protein